MKEITIYTDGGCHGNPGPGGWANVILADGTENPHSGGEHLTTNNRMELMAVIQALTEISTNPQWSAKSITVCTDSQYVKNGITTWIKNWKKNNWSSPKTRRQNYLPFATPYGISAVRQKRLSQQAAPKPLPVWSPSDM